MPAILKGLSGTYAGSQMEIGSQPTIIGCDPLQANLIIPKTRIEISDRHVSIAFDAARQVVILIDMSREGTYLMSGERLPRDQPCALRSGTQFYLGNTGNSFAVEVAGSLSMSPVYATQQAGYDLPAHNHAGFWKRFGARFIDGFVLLIPDLILSGTPLPIVLNWLYFALMESSAYQGTLGKMAMDIKVTDLEGRPISFGRATGRHFAGALSFLTLCIGYMMAGWTERKQALHDMITDCLVENK